MKFIFLLFSSYIFLIEAFLTTYQFRLVSEILSKDFNNYPNYLPIKYKTQEVLFNHSKPFVHNNFKIFCHNSRFAKRFTNYKKNQLLHYGYQGLWKAILKYNGKSNFYNFAKIYVDSELKLGMSNIISSSIIPHRLRTTKKFRDSNKELYKNSFILPRSFYLDKDIKNSKNNKIKLETIREMIQELDPIDKRYFYYKYGYDLNTKKSNKYVGDLLGVSHETVRKKIKKINKYIISQI